MNKRRHPSVVRSAHPVSRSAEEIPVTASTVTWRQTVAAAVAVVVALVGVVVLFSSDGLPAVNAAASGATRWFVHRPSGYHCARRRLRRSGRGAGQRQGQR